MRLRHVVTSFLRRADGRVLLGRRSQMVHTYPGRWAAISGAVETGQPVGDARREVQEETGLGHDGVELLAEGRPVRFTDWDLSTRWVVHPFLFRCAAPEQVRLDWEHVEFEWVDPGRIGDLQTVPRLAEAWQSAASSEGGPAGQSIFQEVEKDREHGAEELGLWTLEGLKAAAEKAVAAQDPQRRLRDACRRAVGLRPSMAPVRSAALEVFGMAEEGSAEDLPNRIQELIAAREEASVSVGEAGAEALPDDAHVVTLSYSSSVLYALEEACDKVSRLVVAESRPANEGRRTAELAASFGIETELVTDAAAAGAVRRADVVLCGADSLLGDGSAVNKTGTLSLCCVAAQGPARALCVATLSKVLPAGHEPEMEAMEPAELGPPIEGVRVRNVYFERVPAALVDEVVAAGGTVRPEELRRRAERLRRLQDRLSPGSR